MGDNRRTILAGAYLEEKEAAIDTALNDILACIVKTEGLLPGKICCREEREDVLSVRRFWNKSTSLERLKDVCSSAEYRSGIIIRSFYKGAPESLPNYDSRDPFFQATDWLAKIQGVLTSTIAMIAYDETEARLKELVRCYQGFIDCAMGILWHDPESAIKVCEQISGSFPDPDK